MFEESASLARIRAIAERTDAIRHDSIRRDLAGLIERVTEAEAVRRDVRAVHDEAAVEVAARSSCWRDAAFVVRRVQHELRRADYTLRLLDRRIDDLKTPAEAA